MDTLAYSECPDEMQQGLHCLLPLKQSSLKEKHHNLETIQHKYNTKVYFVMKATGP